MARLSRKICGAWCWKMEKLSSRVVSLAGDSVRHYRLDIPQGVSLWEGVSQAFAAREVRSAHLDFMPARLSSVVYFTGAPDPEGKWIARYGSPRHMGPTLLLGAMGIFGQDQHGMPLLHCHASMRSDSAGLVGGHIDPTQCVVGNAGLRIYVSESIEIGFRAKLDATSGMHVFHPHRNDGYLAQADAQRGSREGTSAAKHEKDKNENPD